MEEIFGTILYILIIIGILALIGFASEKNAIKDAIYSSARLIVILLIGDLLQEPYDEYYFAVINSICLAIFPAFYFGMTEISKGRLKWVETEGTELPQNEIDEEEYMVADNDIYAEIEQMASLKEKGILSEEEFNEQKKKLLKI